MNPLVIPADNFKEQPMGSMGPIVVGGNRYSTKRFSISCPERARKRVLVTTLSLPPSILVSVSTIFSRGNIQSVSRNSGFLFIYFYVSKCFLGRFLTIAAAVVVSSRFISHNLIKDFKQ